MDQSIILESALGKAKKRIIPFIIVLYVIASLDRSNIGFAALEMNQELAITAVAYGLISGIFNLSYALCEIPSNILCHRFGVRLWTARIMITWGIIASATMFVQSATQLGVLRVILGIAEAGLWPGIVYYMASWFPAKERAKTMALFMLSMPISFVIGAPISTWIMTNISWFGLSGWRWMYLLEGLPAVIFGIIVIFYLVDSPKNAKWLTKEEKECLIDVLQAEKEQEALIRATEKEESIGQVFLNPRSWRLAFIFGFFSIGIVSINFWLPQIIKGLSGSLSTQSVGLLTMIPYIAAVTVALLWSRHSDKTGERKYHTALPSVFQIIGLLIVLLSPGVVIKFIGLTIFVAFYICIQGPLFSLPSVLYSGQALAVLIALMNTLCSLFGFGSSLLFGILQGVNPSAPYVLILCGCIVSFLLAISLGKKDLPTRNLG